MQCIWNLIYEKNMDEKLLETRVVLGDRIGSKKSQNRSHSYFALIPILFVFYLGEEITKYSLQQWTQYYVKTEYFPNETFHKNTSAICHEAGVPGRTSVEYKKVQQQTSHWLLYCKLAEYIPTMIVAFVLPGYSDAVGRKKLLQLAGIGCLIKASLATISIFMRLPLIWIAIGHGLQGVLGGTKGYISLCYSYVADMTVTDSQRVFGMTVVEMAIVLTSTCGGLVTGYMVQNDTLGYSYTVLISAGLMAVSFVCTCLFLSESLPEEKRTTLKPFLTTAKRTFEFYYSPEFKGKRKGYILLLLGLAFFYLGESNRSGLETLYFLGRPFCWDPIQIGYFSMARHGMKSIVGVGLLRLMQFCMSSEAIAILSTLSNMSSYVIEGLAQSTVTVYMATVSGVLVMLVTPMIVGLLSTLTPEHKQGSLFASVAVIETLSTIISMILQNTAYTATVSVMDGFVFFVMAGFCLVDCFLLTMFSCTKPTDKYSYERIND